MSALAGIVHPDRYSLTPKIGKMLEIMKHRGEVNHVCAYQNVELGLIGGSFHQDTKRKICIALDGEMFNLDQVIHELKLAGFQTDPSDIGALLHRGYELWGADLVQKIRGKFVLAIVDQNKKKVLISRDRIGKTPLYWYAKDGYFLFATELKALLASDLIPQTPALDALSSYLFFGFIPQDMSPVDGVSKLLPGHTLTYSLSGHKRIDPYWSYGKQFIEQTSQSEEELELNLSNLIHQSVSARLPKEGEVGCFLSGDLGSTAIATFIREHASIKPPIAITVNFEGLNDEDFAMSQQVAKELGLPHYHTTLQKEALFSNLPTILWHMDEPIADPSVVASWQMAKLAREHTGIVYSGTGCDELFARHTWYTKGGRETSLLERFFSPLFQRAKDALIPVMSHISKSLTYSLLQQIKTSQSHFESLQDNALFHTKDLRKASKKLSGVFSPEVFLQKFHHLHYVKSGIHSLLYFDVKTRLPDCYILQVDRCTGAFGLDWRTPFLDQHIVEFLAHIPESRLSQSSQPGFRLENILKGKLSQKLIAHPKPIRPQLLGKWIRDPSLRHHFFPLLNGTLVEIGLLSRGWIKRELEHLNTSPQAAYHLWAILQLEIWFRLFINYPVHAKPKEMTTQELLQG